MPHEVFSSVARRMFDVPGSLQSLLRRVCVLEMTYDRVFFSVTEIHAQTSGTGLYWRMRTAKNVVNCCRRQQFPACLWFGVGLSPWLVAYGRASADLEFAVREQDRLNTAVASSSRCGRGVTNCHPAATKCFATTRMHPNVQTSANTVRTPRTDLKAFRLPA